MVIPLRKRHYKLSTCTDRFEDKKKSYVLSLGGQLGMQNVFCCKGFTIVSSHIALKTHDRIEKPDCQLYSLSSKI